MVLLHGLMHHRTVHLEANPLEARLQHQLLLADLLLEDLWRLFTGEF
jgi:hypothetical protein